MNQFISPKNIYHGVGSLKYLDLILNRLHVKQVFLLADPRLNELGMIKPILEQLENRKVKVVISTDVVPEPSIKTGNHVVEKIRSFSPDLVIGIGGGSALDLAKAAAVLAGNDGRVEDYLNQSGKKQLQNKGLPKVLIPTTAGTGAEVTDIAVFSLEYTKDVITHEYLLADYAIVDPVLTYTLPPRVTAASGIDAFTHSLEAYTSVNSTPITDMFALEAMKRIVENIRTAVWNGNNEKAREEMALGSLLAGLSFYNAGVAGVHALAYPLGGLYKVPHGESNAVLLPYVYDQIWPSCLEKLNQVAEIMGLPIQYKSKRDIAISLVKGLQDLVKDVGLPTSIRAFNIEQSDIDILVENGMKQTRLLERSPKKLTEPNLREIYQHAYDGKIKSME